MPRLLAALALAASLATPALADERLKVVTTFTVLADMAANVAGEAADVEALTKPGSEIHLLPADAGGYPPGARCRSGAVERAEPRAVVRAVSRQSRRHSLGGGERGRRADGDRHRALRGQAEPACLDVAGCGADLCGEHPRGDGGSGSGECGGLCRQCRGLFRRDPGAGRADPGGAGGHSRGAALAGDLGGGVQLSRAGFRAEGALYLADQRRPAGHAAAGARGDRHDPRA